MQIHDDAAFARLLLAIRERGWENFTREDDSDQVTALGLPPWHCWPSWAATPQSADDEPTNTAVAKTWATAHRMRRQLEKLARAGQ